MRSSTTTRYEFYAESTPSRAYDRHAAHEAAVPPAAVGHRAAADVQRGRCELVGVDVDDAPVDVDLQLLQQAELRVVADEVDRALLAVARRARRRADHLAQLLRTQLRVVPLVGAHVEQLDRDEALLGHLRHGRVQIAQSDLVDVLVVLPHRYGLAFVLEADGVDGLVH